MKTKLIWIMAWMVVVLFATPLRAADAPATTASAQGEKKEESLTEINEKLTNPVSEIWSITFQQNNYILDMSSGKSDRCNSNLNFQPVLPVALTDGWNFITREVMTRLNSVPNPAPR
jgi:hypothetical protein